MNESGDNWISKIAQWITSKGCVVENAYPLVITLTGSVVLWNWRPMPCEENLPDLLSAIISISAIMAGFFATAKAILLSLSNERTVEELRKVDGFRRLVGFFWTGIKVQLLVAAYATVGFFFVDKAKESWFGLWFYCLEVLLLFMATTSYRALHLLSKLLRLVSAK